VVRELSAPGVQDTSAPREVCPNAALVGGQPLEGHGRRLQQGVGREPLMRADQGTQGLRDGEGEEEVRSRQLLVQGMLEPRLGCMLLALGTVPVATGMLDAVLPPTVLALIKAVTIVAALAVLDGADDLTVGEGQLGIALQVFWSKGGEDLAEGGHDRSLPS